MAESSDVSLQLGSNWKERQGIQHAAKVAHIGEGASVMTGFCPGLDVGGFCPRYRFPGGFGPGLMSVPLHGSV